MPLVLTLDKSLSLLEAVVSRREGVGTRALALALGMNVATAHNIARTFCHRGYLRQDATTKHFLPGIRLMLLGRHPASIHSISLSAASVIDEIARKLNESVMLASIEHGHILNLKYVPSRQALRVHESDDISSHSYCTAVGKVLLATLSEGELAEYLHRTTLRRFTDQTLCTPEKLKGELARVAAQGYARTRDEAANGVSAVAVPVRDPWGVTVAGIGLSAPTIRIQNARQCEIFLRELRVAASRIEQRWTESNTAEPQEKQPRRPRNPKSTL